MSQCEKDIEKKFAKWCVAYDILFWKFTSPGRKGVPDRLLLDSRGKAVFLEFKRRGQKPSSLQQRHLVVLNKRSIPAAFVDSFEEAVAFVSRHLFF